MFSFDSSLTVTESAVTGTPDHEAIREWLRIAACNCRNTVRATNCRPARSPPFVWWSKHSTCEARHVPAPCIHRPRKSGYTNYSGCFGKMRSDGSSGRSGRNGFPRNVRRELPVRQPGLTRWRLKSGLAWLAGLLFGRLPFGEKSGFKKSRTSGPPAAHGVNGRECPSSGCISRCSSYPRGWHFSWIDFRRLCSTCV